MIKKLVVAAAIAAVSVLYACSHDDEHSHDEADGGGHTSAYPTCQEIITKCHEFDVGDGPVHDCHEIGHDAKSDAPCVSAKANCLAVCAAAAADSGTADSATDSGGDAGHDH